MVPYRRHLPARFDFGIGEAIIAAIVAVAGFLTSSTTIVGITVGITVYGVSGAFIGEMILLVGTTLLSSLLTNANKPNTTSLGGLTTTMQNVTDPLRIVYGTVRIGPTRVFITTTNEPYNRKLHMVCQWCSGEVEGPVIDALGEMIYFDGQRAQEKWLWWGADPLYTHEFHNGSYDQAVSAAVTAVFPAWADALQGTAYSYFMFRYDTTHWQNIPEVTIVLQGKKLFDPRDGSEAYSENVALCILDFMTHPIDGGKLRGSLFNKQSVIDAANWFDANGYYFNGAIADRKEFLDNLEDMLMSTRVDIIWEGGQYKLVVQKYDAAVMSLDERDIKEDDQKANAMGITTVGINDVPTKVAVAFLDPIDNYNVKYGYWPQEQDLTPAEWADKPDKTIAAVGITDFTQATKIAKYQYVRSRWQRRFAFVGHPKLGSASMADMVAVSHNPLFPVRSIPQDWTNKILRITGTPMDQTGHIAVALLEEDPSIYDDTVHPLAHNPWLTDFPGFFDIPIDPTDLTYDTGEDETTPNVVDAYITFKWSPMGDNLDYDLRWKHEASIIWTPHRIGNPEGVIAIPAMTGTGTLALSSSGDFTGGLLTHFYVEIDGTGSPNTFKWSDNGGVGMVATGVAITGGWQMLENGVKVKFSATTGGVMGDHWTFDATPLDPITVRIGGLKCGAVINWQVRAIDRDHNKSEWITPASPCIAWAPAGPANVSFDDANCNFDGPNPIVAWTALATEPDHYELRTEDANWGAKDIKFIANVASKAIIYEWTAYMSWCDKQSLTEVQRRSLTIYIKAVDKVGNYSVAADSIALTNAAPTMSGFSPIVTMNFFGMHAIVDWSAWPGITGKDLKKYNVYCSTEATCTINSTNLKKTVAVNVHQTELTGLSRGVTYDFRVEPWDVFGEGVASS